MKNIRVTVITNVWAKVSMIANSYKRRLKAFKFFSISEGN